MSETSSDTSGQALQENVQWLGDLRAEVPTLAIRTAVRGASLTTFAVGGPIAVLCEPNSIEELSTLVRFLSRVRVAWRILGAGSNVVIDSAGLQDVVIRLGKSFRTSEMLGEGSFRVGAAASLMSLSRDTAAQGLAGLEFAGGIPASIGGATRMNAGAHTGQLSDVLKAITLVQSDGRVETISVADLDFSYRHASFNADAVVASIEIQLQPDDPKKVAERRSVYLQERKARQPLQSPSAGSVFRNPSPEQPAGKLIELVGLKGTKVGGAKISEQHANWIVNEDRTASSSDIGQLVLLAQEKVQQQFGLLLKPEIVFWS